jgi:hypothetical protein
VTDELAAQETLDAWEVASERAEAALDAVAEAALRHVATSVLAAVPDAVFLEVTFGSFGDGLVAESLHVDGDPEDLPELADDVHDALDDLNEYNSGTWMRFVVDDDDEDGDDEDDRPGVAEGVAGGDAEASADPPLLIDLTLVRERLG